MKLITNNRGMLFFLIIFIVGGVIFYKGYKKEKQVRQFGIETEAEIYCCEQKYDPPGRGGLKWISRFVYNVNGITYNLPIEGKIPIGTKFKVKYSKVDPSNCLLVNPNEFENYPK